MRTGPELYWERLRYGRRVGTRGSFPCAYSPTIPQAFSIHNSGPVHTTPVDVKTEVSHWKRIKYFPSSTLRRRNLKTRQSPVIWICVYSGRKSRDYRDVISFEKAPFSKRTSSTTKGKPAFSNSSRRSFQKAPFSWRIRVDSSPNFRNKAALSGFNTVMATGCKQ